MDEVVILARGKIRRHGVHVRRKHNLWLVTCRRDDICTIFFDLLQVNLVATPVQQFRERRADVKLLPGNRRNIDQLARELENVYRFSQAMASSAASSER